MFLQHTSASRGKGRKKKKKKKPTKTKAQEQRLVATCQLFFHSIVLMETADHKVKEERRKHKEEMLLRLYFNSGTHSASSWSFKAAQHVRKKSSCVDTAHLEDFCLRLSAQPLRAVTYHHSTQQTATPRAGNQIAAAARGLSISETSFLVYLKALPYPPTWFLLFIQQQTAETPCTSFSKEGGHSRQLKHG